MCLCRCWYIHCFSQPCSLGSLLHKDPSTLVVLCSSSSPIGRSKMMHLRYTIPPIVARVAAEDRRSSSPFEVKRTHKELFFHTSFPPPQFVDSLLLHVHGRTDYANQQPRHHHGRNEARDRRATPSAEALVLRRRHLRYGKAPGTAALPGRSETVRSSFPSDPARLVLLFPIKRARCPGRGLQRVGGIIRPFCEMGRCRIQGR